ncbi:hypothetical protein LBMAG34_6340 [Candidatus Saccharibacteria bacterium]|nr:hypothetical protein LBMAG34_6340 [Candidatus Saccharibacteria bacterium]
MPKAKNQKVSETKKEKIDNESIKQQTGSSLAFRKIVRVILIALVLLSLFVLILQLIPNKAPLSSIEQEKYLALVPVTNEKRVIIPKISVNSKIYEGDSSVLDKGTWHRFPDRGNPKVGGNFILAAHRYIFSLLPQRTSEKSVLYNIDKLDVGDKIYIDWQNERYEYVVDKKYKVKPNNTEVEAQSTQAKLTLYSCTKEGQADGREVIEANPIK